ncbi:MAG TPA: SDR family oxidoreductase [Caulobacter sp.]|nr:SDR family oxidoreductase [Caulobacter sp.]
MAYKPFDLTGKVALVTGGNGGIGLGMAEAMAQAGADIVIWGSNRDKTLAAEGKLTSYGVRVKAQIVDCADEAQVVAGMAEAVTAMGRIDTCIANAGRGRGAASFAEMSTDVWNYNMALNLDGVFWTLREAARHMVDRAKAGDPGGSLVAISSLSAIEGAARNEAYATTKGAVISLIKSVAVEHARHGVRANVILPGWIATDMTAGAQGSDVFNSKVISRVPMRRWGEPEDFGGLAVYLASDASRFHTGDSFVIDGGYAIF